MLMCVYLCRYVNKISQKVLHQSTLPLVEAFPLTQGIEDSILILYYFSRPQGVWVTFAGLSWVTFILPV